MLLVFPNGASTGALVGAEANVGNGPGTVHCAVDSCLVRTIQTGKDSGAIHIALLAVTCIASFLLGFDAQGSIFALMPVRAGLGIFRSCHIVLLKFA